MAVSFLDAGPVAETSSGDLSVVCPATVNANDVLILSIMNRDNSTVSVPTGWTLITSRTNGGSTQGWAAWLRADGTEDGSTVVVPRTGTTGVAVGCITRWAGVKTSGSPLNVAGTWDNNGVTQDIAFETGITTTVNNCMVVAIGVKQDNWNTDGAAVMATHSGITFAEAGEFLTSLGSDAGLVIDYGVLATAGAVGATGTIVLTGGTAQANQGLYVALEPATSGSVTIDAPPMSATASTPIPTVGAGGGVDVTILPPPMAATIPTVDMTTTVAVEPPVMTATASMPAPAVSVGQNVTVTAVPMSATASAPSPLATVGALGAGHKRVCLLGVG